MTVKEGRIEPDLPEADCDGAIMFKHAYLLPAAAAALAIMTAPAQANVVISIDKGSQTMSVSVDGQPSYRWAVSTARSGYSTPSGVYHPQNLERSHFSKLY